VTRAGSDSGAAYMCARGGGTWLMCALAEEHHDEALPRPWAGDRVGAAGPRVPPRFRLAAARRARVYMSWMRLRAGREKAMCVCRSSSADVAEGVRRFSGAHDGVGRFARNALLTESVSVLNGSYAAVLGCARGCGPQIGGRRSVVGVHRNLRAAMGAGGKKARTSAVLTRVTSTASRIKFGLVHVCPPPNP
jgi:hypothetical protein